MSFPGYEKSLFCKAVERNKVTSNRIQGHLDRAIWTVLKQRAHCLWSNCDPSIVQSSNTARGITRYWYVVQKPSPSITCFIQNHEDIPLQVWQDTPANTTQLTEEYCQFLMQICVDFELKTSICLSCLFQSSMATLKHYHRNGRCKFLSGSHEHDHQNRSLQILPEAIIRHSMDHTWQNTAEDLDYGNAKKLRIQQTSTIASAVVDGVHICHALEDPARTFPSDRRHARSSANVPERWISTSDDCEGLIQRDKRDARAGASSGK